MFKYETPTVYLHTVFNTFFILEAPNQLVVSMRERIRVSHIHVYV